MKQKRTRKVFFLWWGSHNRFTSLHVSKAAAISFRTRQKQVWKSVPDEKIYDKLVTEEVYRNLVSALNGMDGIRKTLTELGD